MDILLALASPVGFIPLFILAGGIFMFVIVALGGWGERTLTQDSKVFLGILGTVLALTGLAGVILVTYPVVRPNIVMIQNDFNIPNGLSTPVPKPTPTPISPAEQFAVDATMIGGSLAMILMFLGLGIMMIRMGLSIPTNVFSLRYPPFVIRLPKLPRHRSTKLPKDSGSPLDKLPKNRDKR